MQIQMMTVIRMRKTPPATVPPTTAATFGPEEYTCFCRGVNHLFINKSVHIHISSREFLDPRVISGGKAEWDNSQCEAFTLDIDKYTIQTYYLCYSTMRFTNFNHQLLP